LTVRAYYDRTYRADPYFRDDLDTVDVEYQQSFKTGAQQLLWGLEYRATDNTNVSRSLFALSPERALDRLFSAFVRDEIALSPALQLTLAARAGHNDFSGFEYQPTARLSWTPSSKQTVWGAISRAVRTPTRFERDIFVDATDPAANPLVLLVGNKNFDSERVLAYEAGYRWQPASWVFVDLATFYNRYSALASLEIGTPFVDTHTGQTVIPVLFENLMKGRSIGGEVAITIVPTDTLKLIATYSTVSLSLDNPGFDGNRNRFIEGSTPRSIASLRASWDVTPSFSLDSALRYMSAIRKIPEIIDGTGLPGYTELDLRAAWHPTETVELSVAGRNLLHDHHLEFGGTTSRGEAERSIYAKAEWRYR
jgi:iron complex outermembrane receptor protein